MSHGVVMLGAGGRMGRTIVRLLLSAEPSNRQGIQVSVRIRD